MAQKTFVGTTDQSWATAAAWDPSGTPTTGDDVLIPAKASYKILNGLDQSGVTLGVVRFDGFSKTVGNTTAATPSFLRLKCSRIEINLTNTAYISVESTSSTPMVIRRTGQGVLNGPGLFLKNSTSSPLTVTGGYVGVAGRQADTATLSMLRVSGGQVLAGPGATVTTARVDGGELTLQTTASTIDVYGGKAYTQLAGVHTIKSYGGQAFSNSAGDVTVHMEGGSVAVTAEPTTKAVTLKTANSGTLTFDAAVVTIKTTGGTAYTATNKRPASITFA